MAYQKQQPQFVSKKTCRFCEQRIEDIDYKDVKLLQKYINSIAKIDPRKRNGNCPRHQRALSTAIKRARIMALMPFVNR
jgi:small subunit ribosomal protein S18